MKSNDDDDDVDANDFNEDDMSFFDEKSEGKNITVEARSDGVSDRGGNDGGYYYKKGSGGLSN